MSSNTSKRRSAPKRKGGCSTCRSRHVRCDSKEPICTPCQKSRRQCDYLAQSSGSNRLKIVLWQHYDQLALRQLSANEGQSSYEARAVAFFQDKVATRLGGTFQSRFWTHDILAIAKSEPSVRHALTAISSLSESMFKDNSELVHSERRSGTLAIQEQIKAITNLKQMIQETDRPSMEIILATCIIFICLEMLQNNHESALRQMSCGVSMYYNWYTKELQNDSKGPSEIAVRLGQVFGRMMIQTLLFIDTNPREWTFLNPLFTPAMPSIPTEFQSVDAARDCLNAWMCSAYHDSLSSKFSGYESQGSSTPLKILHEWRAAFLSLMTTQKLGISIIENRAIITLQIQYIIAFILGSVGPWNQEIAFDTFDQSFRQIVDLGYQMMNNNTSNEETRKISIPAIDIGCIPAFYFVASRCRDPLTRRQALCLLREGPNQEGIWHSGMLSKIAERIMTIEETGLTRASSSANIPATSRLTTLNAKIASARRIVTLHCSRQPFGLQGDVEILHEEVGY